MRSLTPEAHAEASTLDVGHPTDLGERALELALGFLSYRPRSEYEVRERLRRKPLAPAVVDATVQRLKVLRLLDDRQFALYWVEQRQTHRPRGCRLLRLELQRKGIDADTASEALEQAGGSEALLEAAYRAAERKSRVLRSLPLSEFQQKLSQFLLRRGFDHQTARKVSRCLWSEAEHHPRKQSPTENANPLSAGESD